MNKSIPIAIIIVGILIAGAVVYTNYSKPSEEQEGILSSQEAAEKVITFINDVILQGQASASLIESIEENGLYRVKFSVQGEEVESYVTLDGKLFFPQGIDLTAELEGSEEATEDASLESFAKCLDEKGMKFYGAYWCSWCKKQKELFADAAQYLPYIECIDPETDQISAECTEAGIQGFPTWEFPNGEKSSGYKSLEELSEASGCPLE